MRAFDLEYLLLSLQSDLLVLDFTSYFALDEEFIEHFGSERRLSIDNGSELSGDEWSSRQDDLFVFGIFVDDFHAKDRAFFFKRDY